MNQGRVDPDPARLQARDYRTGQHRHDRAMDLYGQEPLAVDRDLAALLYSTCTLAAHGRDNTVAAQPLPAGWQALADGELIAQGISAADLSDARSGFDATLYRNDDGLVMVAFNGIEHGRDWRCNLRQDLGLSQMQHDQAVALTCKAQQAWGGQLVLGGHAGGGALAAAAGMLQDVPTVTFNAAGVQECTLERFDSDADVLSHQARQGQLRSYEMGNALLVYLQEDSLLTRWVMPDAPGHRIALPDPAPDILFDHLQPGVMLKHRLDLHSIDAVLLAQQAGTPEHANARGNAQQLLLDAARGLSHQRAPLGLHEDSRFYNTVSHVAAHASQDGLQRIDHLLLTPDQQRLVAIQGALNDPAQQRSVVLAEAAAREPALLSCQWLQQCCQATGMEPLQAQRGAEAQPARSVTL